MLNKLKLKGRINELKERKNLGGIQMFINKTMNFIMDESDVMTVIKIIDKHHKNHIFSKNYCVKNCGWADENKWFIMGDVTRKTYDMIISDLRKQFKLEEKELKRIYLTKIES